MTRSTRRIRLALFAGLLVAACDGSVTQQNARAGDAPVTQENLLASERYWPYHVALTRPYASGGGRATLAPGLAGVLIRIEEGGVARIDFGRDGLAEVPVAETDLVANAERIRLGELAKDSSNFVLDIGPRLVDPAADALRPFGLREAGEYDAFLCVFADPGAASFDGLAAEMKALTMPERVLTLLFPQGHHPDPELRERLRSLAWPVPFVMDHLAEPYSRSLLPDGAAAPYLLLVSREGRLLHASAYAPGALPPGLVTALAAEPER
jgi:hypothetical protein